jgi:hypothetical protein
MTEQELRALVRDTIARHLGGAAAPPASPPAAFYRQHTSHGLLPVSTGAENDGPCIIEPAVMCNHCGYCQSYGH